MDYAYHSEMVEKDKKKNELDNKASFATILNFKFCDFRTSSREKKKYPVNFHSLKEMCKVGGVLEDAHIFRYLFGLECANEYFKKQDEGFDFYEYDIAIDDWNRLLKFLKFGECELINGQPEQLMEVCNKFGGIPAYDRWYQNIAQLKKKAEDERYNPMIPEQDTKQLYAWRACPGNRMEWFGKKNKGFSVAGHHKIGTVSYIYYWRKLKSDAVGVSKGSTTIVEDIQGVMVSRTTFPDAAGGINVNDDMHDFRADTILENFE